MLETLKTFLFVPKCLFIVAADQQVLEQALRDEVRQHTPRDATNPYYSAGSSYLDKVFQFQLTLPPLKSTTLSRFALRLSEGLPGVWQRIPELDAVISILIPTHVVSPRRVKVLLNRYAIAYRLAERRAHEGRLDRDVGSRATELAKLVCLQCEFPLFADDLRVDARLPELVRQAADGEQLPETVRGDVANLVHRYADQGQLVARLLASDDDEDSKSDHASVGSVGRKHAQQLINYLRKTREVAGPGPDLLFLESAGADHGVDAIRAEQLHRAAIDNDLNQVLSLVTDVSAADEARGALLVLADVVREDQPGYEGQNALSSLLQAIALSGIELPQRDADYMADAITAHLPRSGLQEQDIPGALKLSDASSRAVASKLFRSVVEHEKTTIDPALASLVVGYLRTTPSGLSKRVEMIVGVALLGDSAGAAESLQRLDDGRSRYLVGAAFDQIEDIVRLHVEASTAEQSEEGESEADPDDLLESEPAESLASVHDTLSESHPATARVILDVMLRLSSRELRNTVADRLQEHAPIEDPDLVAAVATAVGQRRADDWPRWLEPLCPGAFALDAVSSRADVGGLVLTLWRKLIATPLGDADVVAAVTSLARAAQGSQGGIGQVREASVAEGAESAFVSAEDLESRKRVWALGDHFADAGLASEQDLSDLRMAAAADTLYTEFPVQDDGTPGAPPSEVVDGVLEILRTRGAGAGEDGLKVVAEATQESPWLSDESTRCLVVLRTVVATGGRFEAAPMPGLQTMQAVAREAAASPYAREAIGIWITHPAVAPDDLFDIFAPLGGSAFAEPERTALMRRAETLPPDERWEFVDRAMEAFVSGTATRSFVGCLGLSSLDSARMAELLSELWSEGLRLEEKTRLLELWMLTKVSSPAALQKLVRNVYIPLAQSGPRSLDLAIKNFGLVAHVQNLRRSVREALRNSATNGAQRARIEEKLQEANWKSRSLKSLGRARDID